MTDRITANLPARDMDETAAFYQRLGFTVGFKDDGWMILNRGAMELEFFPHQDVDPKTSCFSACFALMIWTASTRILRKRACRRTVGQLPGSKAHRSWSHSGFVCLR